jgi:hypothetical protein
MTNRVSGIGAGSPCHQIKATICVLFKIKQKLFGKEQRIFTLQFSNRRIFGEIS